MRLLSAFLLCTAVLGVTPTAAQECNNPDAIGPSRTMTVNPIAYPLVGKLQYMETIRLQDHEIVLTFDDGPVENGTETILETLAHECIKATFFMIGINAVEAPDLAKRVYDEGHTVGFHTFSHPDVETISYETAKADITKGMSAVRDALGEGRTPAPFYRPPYLSMTKDLERFLNSLGVMIWSIDADSEDWLKDSDEALFARTIGEIEKAGKGILLMHDIQPATRRILPQLLRELKNRNYHIVHVVPGSPDQAKTDENTKTN
jgi:peptidoglycan-N-acetylglucosamine deacetylase